jgi:hypothetical protein
MYYSSTFSHSTLALTSYTRPITPLRRRSTVSRFTTRMCLRRRNLALASSPLIPAITRRTSIATADRKTRRLELLGSSRLSLKDRTASGRRRTTGTSSGSSYRGDCRASKLRVRRIREQRIAFVCKSRRNACDSVQVTSKKYAICM